MLLLLISRKSPLMKEQRNTKDTVQQDQQQENIEISKITPTLPDHNINLQSSNRNQISKEPSIKQANTELCPSPNFNHSFIHEHEHSRTASIIMARDMRRAHLPKKMKSASKMKYPHINSNSPSPSKKTCTDKKLIRKSSSHVEKNIQFQYHHIMNCKLTEFSKKINTFKKLNSSFLVQNSYNKINIYVDNKNINRSFTKVETEEIQEPFSAEQISFIKGILYEEELIYEQMDEHIKERIISSMTYIKIKQNHFFFIYDKENEQMKCNTNSTINSVNNNKEQFIYIIERGKVEMNVDNRIYSLEKGGIISTKALIKHTVHNCFLQAKSKKVVVFQLSIEIYSSLFLRYIEKCNNEKLALLKKIYLFNGLDKEILIKIAEESSKEMILKRKFLIKEDKMPKAIYLIIEGEVVCYRGDNIVRKINKDSIFGEIPLFTQMESMYGYCAEKDTELFRVKYELIHKAIGNGELFIQKCITNMFSVAVRNNRILRKYFNEDHYINFLFKIFRMKYYTHEQIASTKNKKLFIPLAGIVYLKTSQTNENYDSHILLNGLAPEHIDKANISNYYQSGEICGEDLLNDTDDENTINYNNEHYHHNNNNIHESKIHQQLPTKKVWSDECYTFEASWIDILKTIQCSNIIGSNFYSSKSLTLQSLNSVNMMNISSTSMLERMNYLRKVPYIKSISEMKLFILAENLKIIFLKENEVIIRDGPNSDRLYIITQGKAKLIINDIEVKVLEPISYIGDISGIQNSYEQRASFYAKTNITCYYLDKEIYEEVIETNVSNTKVRNNISNGGHLLTLNDLYYLRELGQGSYGKVYLVHDQKKKYALKSASVDMLCKKKEAIQYYKEEKNILNIIDHPFVVQLLNTFKTRQYIFLLMEYIEGHTLKRYMDVPLVFKTVKNITKVTFISAILCSVLNYLQRKRIIHRDLKPGNLMLEPSGYIKVIDFGVAKDLTDKDSTSTFIGTIHYMAPEMLKGKHYSFSIDIWAIGVIIYELFYGQLPYGIDMKDPQSLLNDIKERKVLLSYEPKHQNINDVIKDLLHRNSSKRFNNFNRWKNWELFREFDMNSLLSYNMTSPLLEEGVLPNISSSHFEKSKRGSSKKLPANVYVNERVKLHIVDLENTGCPLSQFIKNTLLVSGSNLGEIDSRDSLIECFNDF